MKQINLEVRSPCRLIYTINKAKLALEKGAFEPGETEITVSVRVKGASMNSLVDRLARTIFGHGRMVRFDKDKDHYIATAAKTELPRCIISYDGSVITCVTYYPILLNELDIKIC